MTEQQSPGRLKNDPECGEYLLADKNPFSSQRLADNAAAVERRIAEGAQAGLGHSVSRWFKAGLGLLALLGLVYVGLSLPAEDSPALPAGVDTLPATAVVPAAPEPAAPAALVEPFAATEPQQMPAPDPAPHKTFVAKPRKTPEPPVTPVADETEQGDLREQLLLFQQARAAAGKKQFDRASEILDDLTARFPDSPLVPDAMLSRLEYLMRSDQTVAALRLATYLAKQPEHAGRRGELLRVAGDLHRMLSDCDAARRAYAQAKKLDIGAQRIREIRRGMRQCSGR